MPVDTALIELNENLFSEVDTGMPVDTALFELNENLFSEVDTVIQIEKGEHSLEMESSSSAISINAFLVRSGSNPYKKFNL
ncbi:hypothetical protein SUGI_0226270 [Cryptomeria japonica]|nr:hypothetical protein SUGI_0226270 [Cryptomeria japonica]